MLPSTFSNCVLFSASWARSSRPRLMGKPKKIKAVRATMRTIISFPIDLVYYETSKIAITISRDGFWWVRLFGSESCAAATGGGTNDAR